MDEYLDMYKQYHQEKIDKLSGRNNKCLKCNSEKEFYESNTSLTISCPKCGNILNITLPIYYNKNDIINDTNNKMNEGFNLDIISKYIKVDGIEDFNTKKEELSDTINLLKEKGKNIHNNDMIDNYYKSLQDNYNNIIVIYDKIKTSDDVNLYKEYIELSKKLIMILLILINILIFNMISY